MVICVSRKVNKREVVLISDFIRHNYNDNEFSPQTTSLFTSLYRSQDRELRTLTVTTVSLWPDNLTGVSGTGVVPMKGSDGTQRGDLLRKHPEKFWAQRRYKKWKKTQRRGRFINSKKNQILYLRKKFRVHRGKKDDSQWQELVLNR